MGNRFILTLIRHLPTPGNEAGQYIGWTDESILPGFHQEMRLPWHAEIVYGSDLKRCIESAGIYFPHARYQSDARLRESHFGDWEGKTYDMLKENDTYRRWIDHPDTEKPPRGESLKEVKTRVIEGLTHLLQHPGQHFVVTHGGPIRILLTQYSPEERDFWSWHIPHRSAWQLAWESVQAFKEGKRCVSLSEVPITEKKHT